MPQWRTRSCGISKWLGKQNCSFDSTGKCISSNSGHFSKFIAFEVNDPQTISLTKDWHLIKEDEKEVECRYIFSFSYKLYN